MPHNQMVRTSPQWTKTHPIKVQEVWWPQVSIALTLWLRPWLPGLNITILWLRYRNTADIKCKPRRKRKVREQPTAKKIKRLSKRVMMLKNKLNLAKEIIILMIGTTIWMIILLMMVISRTAVTITAFMEWEWVLEASEMNLMDIMIWKTTK